MAGSPRSFKHSTRTVRIRGTSAVNPERLRQPSKNSTLSEPVEVMVGLMTTWKGTGLRSRSRNCSTGTSLWYSARSSITASCRERPTCGAASHTPGASCMHSRMDSIKLRISLLTISAGLSGRARCRKTGSPACTISSFIRVSIRDQAQCLLRERL